MGSTPTECPSVSVIICHHTGRPLLARCLASVQASVGMRPEIIVVTSDPTYVNLAVSLLYLEDGPAAKRNLGVRRATSDTLVFLDDDVEIHPRCLYEFWKFLEEHPTCGMAFAKIYKMEEGRRDEFDATGSWVTPTGFLYDQAGNGVRDRGQFDTPTKCLASKSATCAIRRSAFTAVGQFDRDYFILGEETDLAWRLWLRGWECWYVPTAVSWHAFGCESLKPKQTFYTNDRIFYRGCLNYLRCLTTNLGAARLACMLPIHLAGWTVAFLGFSLRGEWSRASHLLRALSDYIRTLPATLRKRHRVQASRVLSDRVLFHSIYSSPGVSYYLMRLWRYWTTQLHG